MPPLIRNILIRLTASIERSFRGLVNLLITIARFFSRLFGLTQPSYYMEETSQAQPTESLPIAPTPVQQAESARRRAGKEVDSFRKMAQQIKQEQKS